MANEVANWISLGAFGECRPTPPKAKVSADASDRQADVRALSRAIVAGNEEAFGKFYDEYHGRLYGFLLVLTSGREETARELHQQVMIKVARKFRVFQTEIELWAWLSEVARNAFRDYLRSEGRRLKRSILPDQEKANEPPEQLCQWLDEAMAALDSNERELIERAYFDEQAQADIANAHGVTVKAVESKLARTRAKIKSFILRKAQDEP